MANKYFSEIILLTKTYHLLDFIDWLTWHLNVVNVDHIHIFDNESHVDIKWICEQFESRVSYEVVHGWANQYQLYETYINTKSNAEWVFPIDDDEFLYIKPNYASDINSFIKKMNGLHKTFHKISIGWLNLFPAKKMESRSGLKSIVDCATTYNHDAVALWQSGDLPVKTMVHRQYQYRYLNAATPHNPDTNCPEKRSITPRNEPLTLQYQARPTEYWDNAVLFHYQYKTVLEWYGKCLRGSPASKDFSELKHKQMRRIDSLYSDTHSYKTCKLIQDKHHNHRISFL